MSQPLAAVSNVMPVLAAPTKVRHASRRLTLGTRPPSDGPATSPRLHPPPQAVDAEAVAVSGADAAVPIITEGAREFGAN